MAEGFLRSFDANLEVHSAGTSPTARVHPKAVQVMQEVGVDLSANYPKDVAQFIDQAFDFVITVCGNAKETCPVFAGEVKNKLHIGFEDPAEATGSEEEVIAVFRKIRDEIRSRFNQFYQEGVKA